MSKNKLDCPIVRDLLALYHDKVVSAETSSAVEEHIAQCSECAAELDKLRHELPAAADHIDTGKSFQKFAESRKKKHRLLYLLFFGIGASVVLTLILVILFCFFLTRYLIGYSPNAFPEPRLICHYRFEDCPYGNETAHRSEEDHALFLYMPEPAGSRNMDIERNDGDVNIVYKHAVVDPEEYGEGLRYRILVVPVDDSCTTLSVNGKKVYDIGEPDTELPGYVEAYHELQSRAVGMWDEEYIGEDSDRELPCDYFCYYPDGDDDGRYIKWDLDGNIVEKTLENTIE